VEEAPPAEKPRVARGALLDISEVDTVPQPLNKPPPEYPPLARRLRLEGAVSMRLLIGERGKVQSVDVISTDANDLLIKAAGRAARAWTYSPATKDDVPVKVWIVERVVFQR
jgi:protein TonB